MAWRTGPRDPRAKALYRIMREHLETVLAVHEDGLVTPDASQGVGPLGAHVERAARAYLECGLFSA